MNPTPGNAPRVYRALSRFGAPMDKVASPDFADPQLIFQIGVEPNRIDVLMSVQGVSFDSAWPSRTESTYAGVPIHVIGTEDLKKAKKASGRPQDLLDLDRLA